MKLILDAH